MPVILRPKVASALQLRKHTEYDLLRSTATSVKEIRPLDVYVPNAEIFYDSCQCAVQPVPSKLFHIGPCQRVILRGCNEFVFVATFFKSGLSFWYIFFRGQILASVLQ